METACVLAELGADETIVSAALLKDVLSQSMMTEQQLRPLIPPAVGDLVVKVGRLDDICKVTCNTSCGTARLLVCTDLRFHRQLQWSYFIRGS